MRSIRIILLAAVVVATMGWFAAAPYRASDVDTATKTNEAARLNNIGVAYMNQQLFEKALKSFEAASAQDPKLATARVNRGVALLNLQHVDEARAILEDVVKQDPKDAHAWYNLGLFYKNSSDTDSAITAFKHVTEIDPGDADTWYFLATVYAQGKQYPAAIESFQHALQLNPLHASAEFGLSRAYQQSADSDHAREHLKKFQYIKDNKLGSPMSLTYGEQGQYSRAEEAAGAPEKVPAAIPVKFVDVTGQAGLAPATKSGGDTRKPLSDLGSGACFLDYDNDGKADLFVATNGAEGGMSLYHNLGNGKFQDVTTQAGLDPRIAATGCTAGDYDNDGFTDLAVSVNRGILVLHNEKDGKFKDVTAAAGINSPVMGGLTFVDYDHDGDLDLFGASGFPTATNEKNSASVMWRNNGDGTFTNVGGDIGVSSSSSAQSAIGTDYNNDRAVDLVVADWSGGTIFQNPREGKFLALRPFAPAQGGKDVPTVGVAVLDFDHDGWMDIALTRLTAPALTLWHNNHGKSLEQVPLPDVGWAKGYGLAAFDYDNDGWIDLVAVGETKEGKSEVRLFRNLGRDGFKDVTSDVGLDKVVLKNPRAIVTADYDGAGATDLLITQNHGPVFCSATRAAIKTTGCGLSLKGLNDNKSAIGTKVEVFSGRNRQKFEIYGSSGYLGQNSTDTCPWVLDRRSRPTSCACSGPPGSCRTRSKWRRIVRSLTWNRSSGVFLSDILCLGWTHYELVGDLLGAGVVGHWVAPGERNVARPTEYIKVDR